jgi:hypothetical protein
VENRTEFGCCGALIAFPLVYLVVWVAAQSVSSVVMGHNISDTGYAWSIVISLSIAAICGRRIGIDSVKGEEQRKLDEENRLREGEAAAKRDKESTEREREKLAATKRKVELLGRSKLSWSEEEFLAKEEAKQSTSGSAMRSQSKNRDVDRSWQVCAVNFCRCNLPKRCIGSEDCGCGNPRVCTKSDCGCGLPKVCPVPACTCGYPKIATDKWSYPVNPLSCPECDLPLPAHKTPDSCPWCELISEGHAESVSQMVSPLTMTGVGASRDKKDHENRRGARDASEGRMRHAPWAGPFESHKSYDERRDAYNAGYDNTNRQRDK